ncbi:MAG: histidine phosphatase family protein [Chloroflexi bacterium]|nr:histidine phosphatase family protein [Chloroflexota bacterium]
MEIILARHGETEWNVKEVFRGRIDVELNDTGRKQAELLAGYLSKTSVEAVYSSPLKRALDTAGAIARKQGLSVIVTPGLIDLDFGEWQGILLEEVSARYPALFQEWTDHPERVKIPGAETLDEVRQRALEVIHSILANHNSRVVLVTHRVVNKVLICALLGLDTSHFWNIKQDTAAISTFAYDDGRFTLTEHNNTCYLKPLQMAQRKDF